MMSCISLFSLSLEDEIEMYDNTSYISTLFQANGPLAQNALHLNLGTKNGDSSFAAFEFAFGVLSTCLGGIQGYVPPYLNKNVPQITVNLFNTPASTPKELSHFYTRLDISILCTILRRDTCWHIDICY